LSKDIWDQGFDIPQETDGEDTDAIWLLSFSDLMTLLFTFFVVLYSAAIEGGTMLDSMKTNLAVFFKGQVVSENKNMAEIGPKGENLEAGTGALVNKEGQKPKSQGRGVAEKGALMALEKSVLRSLSEDSLLYDIETNVTAEGLELTFSTVVLFDSGQALLRQEVSESFMRLAVLISRQAPAHRLKVEGHTDNQPVATVCYPSNWELSGARAAAIIRIFEDVGYQSKQLTAIGYGDTRPRVPNKTKSGQALLKNMAHNRRVVIKIIAPQEKS